MFTRTNVCDILNTPKIEGDDMKIQKGYVFRMYPTEKQEELLIKLLDALGLYIIIFWMIKLKNIKKLEKVKVYMIK